MTEVEPAPLPDEPASIALRRTTIPAWSLVVVGVVSVQLGAAIAKQLFEAAGTSGVVFLRTFLAALMFTVIWRPPIIGYSKRTYGYIAVYGVVIALNMLLFYATINLIPLGVADAIAFAGPLGVAVWDSRKIGDLAWIIIAAAGILLLSPITGVALDPFGILLALITAAAWAAFIIVTKRASGLKDSNVVLVLAMWIAAIVAAPFGLYGAVNVLNVPSLVLLAGIVALLSSAVPVALEFQALKELTPYTASLLFSLEPVAASVIGALVLHEALEWREITGILLVTIAAIGTARSVR